LEQITQLHAQMQELGIEARMVPVVGSGHSSLVESILVQFRREVAALRLNPPVLPFISNVTGTWITEEQAVSPDYWVRHLRQTVRFGDGVGVLLQAPRAVLLECGPGQILRNFAEQHPARGAEHVLLSSMRHRAASVSDIAFLLETIGKLWSAGVPIDWEGF